ncbi:PREDICTED: golgin subfamily A member 4-like [Camelina sativa]|uniref:Golgin subfamily A member 4-like n=1 Tax=Camelina sativa TaxID=90675 RepID=A0ABM0XEU6_CAMSA|nr:PREDICTED: golgin subfamily A member 4-like [Camelina sativa]XP_010484895.1 PREDICTED: golgin subfamily A member 4-like [Camelina sativa]
MEEATPVSSEVPLVKVVNEEVTKEDRVMDKEEEDPSYDGGFVKVEKEGINAKYGDDEKALKQVSIEASSNGSQRELHEAQEKAKELELELEKVTGELKRYESENTLLKDELLSTKGRLDETEKKHEEHEVVKKKLQEQISEGEARHSSQLKSLKDALQLHDDKHKELTEVKEAFDGLGLDVENSRKKMIELEERLRLSAVKAEKFKELEEKLMISDEKLSKTDALLSQALSQNSVLELKLKSLEELSEKVAELKSALIMAEEEGNKSTSQRQEYQEKVTKLETSLNQSAARISELEEDLRIALQKGAEHEDIGNVSTQRSVELQGLFQTSQSKLEEKLKDLEALQAKNSSLEAALSVAMEKESELSVNLNAVTEKLKSAEERLEKQAREIDEATTRSIDLEALHKHSELKIQKAMEDFSCRDTEAKSLTEKSKDLEERIRLYEVKLAEASDQSLSLKEEIDQSSAENELLADTNNQLKIKIQELQGYLESEKETENEKFKQRDTEVKDLRAKLKSHENLIEEHKRQILEASGVADTRRVELEEALLKLKTLESTVEELEKVNGDLAEVNMNLNQKLANHGSETGGFQAKLSALEAEKDQTVKELQTAIEDLTKQLTSEGERLRSQISSLEEKNKQVNEIYQTTKNELVKLQEKLQEDKSKSEAMVSEIGKLSSVAAEKLVLESNYEQVAIQLKEVEAQLKEKVEKVAELTSKLQEHEHKASDRDVLDEQAVQLHKEFQASHTLIAEQKEAVSQKHSELEATLKKSQEELDAKKSMILHLESMVDELKEKVKHADAKSKETESAGKEEVEVKSRDIDLSVSTPKQRKSKKNLDASLSHSSSSGHVMIQTAETSHLMTLNIVLGVAIVSVILGIILGKKY